MTFKPTSLEEITYGSEVSDSAIAASTGKVWIKHFLAGSAGGLAGVVIGHPFDTIRVRLQTSHGLYQSATDCFVKTVKGEGIGGLYKGLSVPLVATTFLKAITFATFGYFLDFQKPNPDFDSSNLPLYRFFIAGLGAGIVNSVFSAPVERAKIVLQLQMPSNSNSTSTSTQVLDHTKTNSLLKSKLHGIQKLDFHFNSIMNSLPNNNRFKGPVDVFKKIGFGGMYRGLTPTVAKEMIGCGTYFTTYEFLLRKLSVSSRKRDGIKPSIGVMFFSGGLTGVITWTIMFPLDIIKSRVQAQTVEMLTIPQVIRNIYHEGGIQAFYKGWRPAVLRALPAHAAILGTYEVMIKVIGDH